MQSCELSYEQESKAGVRQTSKLKRLLGGSAVLMWLGTSAAAQNVLPKPPAPFAGKVEPSTAQSTPSWPQEIKAPTGAPNIVVILLDDVGFGSTSTFGGPVNTPTLTKLAQGGLSYNNFHVNAICSPTRAALLTGRNAHEVGYGHVSDDPAGYPGYNTVIPKSAATIAEVLKDHGYSTAAFGKWHNTPLWEVGPVGPFDRWPTGEGFEYFYGFMAGQDDQFTPRLYRDTIAVNPPKTPKQGYILTHDLANDAIRWLHNHDALAPKKPFFLYFATPGAHVPHQALPAWIAKYKGKFGEGWDKLRAEIIANQKKMGIIPADADPTPRPRAMPAWDSLSPDEQKIFERKAQVFAGYLSETDHEIGRVLDAIRQEGQMDNTLIIFIAGDNGASAESGPNAVSVHHVDGKPATTAERLAALKDLGGPKYQDDYGASWAWAFDAPFRWTKEVASHLGGTTDPMVIYWPDKVKQAGLRTEWQHVTDIAPTIYAAVGIKAPEAVDGIKQMSMAGDSFLDSFTNPQAPSTHHIQAFESYGNRGIYKDGWWAGNRSLLPWQFGLVGRVPIDRHPWQLYDLTTDYTQAHDLAAKDPDKLKEMEALFDEEAEKNDIYPLVVTLGQDPPAFDRHHYVFRSGVDHIPVERFTILKGDTHSITARVDIPAEQPGNGVIIAAGGFQGGFTLFLKDGRPIYEIEVDGHIAGKIASNEPLKPGWTTVGVNVDFNPPPAGMNIAEYRHVRAATGTITMSVDGKQVGSDKMLNFPLFAHDTLDIGEDLGSTVGDDYSGPNPFNGKIDTVDLDIK